MVDVRRVKLPGVGVLHTFITDDGGKVGVIAHRSGHSDLITFADDEGGPDASKVSLRLSEDEAHTLAELLGQGVRLVLAEPERHLAGVRATLVIREGDQVAVAGAVGDDADLAAIIRDEGVQDTHAGELDTPNVNHETPWFGGCPAILPGGRRPPVACPARAGATCSRRCPAPC